MRGAVPDMESQQAQDVVARWCRAGEQRDAPAAAACLAPDVELISPLTEQFKFRGPEQVRALLEAAFAAIEDIQFHTRVGDGDIHAVFYRAHLGAQSLEEAQLLRLDTAHRIREITLFGRPLPALTGLMAALGPKLARKQGRPGLAAFLTASTAPLHAMTRLGEQAHRAPHRTPKLIGKRSVRQVTMQRP